jgi:hypothetical protein
MLTVPIYFKTDLVTIPANVPYIWPYKERILKWYPRVPQNGRMRVGIVWAGNSAHGNDRNRSMPLERLVPLFSMPDVDFISVQKNVTEEDAALLEEHGVLQLGQEFADFADTAAVIKMLDLLVTVDTSVAHLAGAMGQPVALLVPYSPDWRWMLDRTDSPWYPTMRLFRQSKSGDWEGVIELLGQELGDAARRRSGRQ